jgi:Tol biopolymer transport system component
MIPSQGGSKKRVVEHLSAESFSLSPDGRQIAFPRWTQDRKEIHLIVSNIDATNERKVATKTEDLIGKPAWSPDGKSIAFSASNERGAGIVEIQLEDGTERIIVSQIFRDILDLEWLPDNSGLVAIANNKSEATSQVWFISYPAGEARRVTNDTNHYMSLNSTADSSTLCAIQRRTHSTISVIPNEKNALAKQITAGATSDGSAGIAWMPDGNIVYTSNSGDNADIWMMEADGTNQTQLTSNAGQNIQPSVSSDGQFIFFASNRTGTFHIWRMNRDGNNQEQITKGNGEFYPQYSSYGKCLIYESESPNSMGSKRVLRMPIDGGEPIPIINKRSYHPIISPDGKMVAFRIFSFGYDNNGIVVAPIEGGSVTGILNGTFESTPFCWSHDSGALIYLGDQSGQPANRKPGEKHLWTRRLYGGTSQQIMSVDRDVAFFEQSKEGKWFLYAKPFQTDDVILIKRFK